MISRWIVAAAVRRKRLWEIIAIPFAILPFLSRFPRGSARGRNGPSASGAAPVPGSLLRRTSLLSPSV